jgi:hypothetical protein
LIRSDRHRNAQQAVQQAQAYINEGYQHIVDIDLKNFFDEVDHCKLMQLLYNKVKCPVTLRLIRLGVDFCHAYTWSRTRMGGWAVSQSPILVTTITIPRL